MPCGSLHTVCFRGRTCFDILVFHNSSQLFLVLEHLIYKPYHVREGMVYNETLDEYTIETTFVCEKSPFVHRVKWCKPLFRLMCVDYMHCFLENFHVHIIFTQKYWYMFLEYLHRVQISRHFQDTLPNR